MDRWRGRTTGLAIMLTVVVGASVLIIGAVAAFTQAQPMLMVTRASDGSVLVSLPVPDGRFALSYRNSLYGSLAEERFVVADDGELRLQSLAADELAVLEEYYAIDTPASRAEPDDRRDWMAKPAAPVALARLTIAATDLGQRTLIIPGHEPIELFELVDGDPAVILEVAP